MTREEAIKILKDPNSERLEIIKAVRFAVYFMENHKEPKPTEQDTAHEPIMTDRENKIYNMVHTWCDEQAQDIPDQNRRYLMDAIVGMIDPQQDEPSNNLEVANTDLKKAIELTREIKDREGYNSFHGLKFFELNANEREALKTVIEAAEKSKSNTLIDKIAKDLGDTNRKFTIWHDGGEWLISFQENSMLNCKTLNEWLNPETP